MTAYLKTIILATLAICLILPPAIHAADEDMVTSIMKLRADVEALYTKIDENKENTKTQMKSFSLQIADSEAQINRLNTSVKLADLELEKIQIQIANTSTENVELRPVLQYAIRMLKKNIQEGLPFKMADRLAALERIETELKEKLITEEKALMLLWASYEDNIRLTSEIGLFKQNIEVNNENVSATVAKIGSVMLFFKTPDNQVGYVVKDGKGYSYKPVNDKEKQKQVLALFDALNKQIRTGYFTLPNALVCEGGSI